MKKISVFAAVVWCMTLTAPAYADSWNGILTQDKQWGCWGADAWNNCMFSKNMLMGTDGKDRLTGTSGRDIIYGGGKSDILRGRGGHDVMYGHGGSDSIYGGGGHDYIRGGHGNDFLHGEAGKDVLFGDAGNDWISGGPGSDWISGGVGNDRLEGNKGNDVLIGGAGQDVMIPGPGQDFIVADYDDIGGAQVWDESKSRYVYPNPDIRQAFFDNIGTGWTNLNRNEVEMPRFPYTFRGIQLYLHPSALGKFGSRSAEGNTVFFFKD